MRVFVVVVMRVLVGVFGAVVFVRMLVAVEHEQKGSRGHYNKRRQALGHDLLAKEDPGKNRCEAWG